MGYPSCLNDVYARYGCGGRAKTAAHAKAALAVSSPSGDVLQRFLTGARQRLSGTGDSSQPGAGTGELRRLPYYPGSRPGTDMLKRLPGLGLGWPNAANKPSWLLGGGGTGAGDMFQNLLAYPRQRGAAEKPSWLPLGAGTERENKSWTRLYNPLGTSLSWLNDPDHQRWEEQWGKKLRSYDFMADPYWQKQWSKMLMA